MLELNLRFDPFSSLVQEILTNMAYRMIFKFIICVKLVHLKSNSTRIFYEYIFYFGLYMKIHGLNITFPLL